MMMKLYSVTTIAKKYDGCKNVTLNWFCDWRAESRPYAELIENFEAYETDAGLDELFSEAEATALKAFLDCAHGEGGVTTIKEELPGFWDTGFGSLSVGGADGFFCMLNLAPRYDLPFRTWGYVKLEGCELTDGSGVYHHHLVSKETTDDTFGRRMPDAEFEARAAEAVRGWPPTWRNGSGTPAGCEAGPVAPMPPGRDRSFPSRTPKNGGG